MQKEDQNKLYTLIEGYIDPAVIKRKNRSRGWEYGYNKDYDIVIISKDGTLGEIYNIQGLLVGLPAESRDCRSRSMRKDRQYWEREEEPKPLQKIKSIFQWNGMPNEFKAQ